MNDAIKSILKRFIGCVGNSLPVSLFCCNGCSVWIVIVVWKNHTHVFIPDNHV